MPDRYTVAPAPKDQPTSPKKLSPPGAEAEPPNAEDAEGNAQNVTNKVLPLPADPPAGDAPATIDLKSLAEMLARERWNGTVTLTAMELPTSEYILQIDATSIGEQNWPSLECERGVLGGNGQHIAYNEVQPIQLVVSLDEAPLIRCYFSDQSNSLCEGIIDLQAKTIVGNVYMGSLEMGRCSDVVGTFELTAVASAQSTNDATADITTDTNLTNAEAVRLLVRQLAGEKRAVPVRTLGLPKRSSRQQAKKALAKLYTQQERTVLTAANSKVLKQFRVKARETVVPSKALPAAVVNDNLDGLSLEAICQIVNAPPTLKYTEQEKAAINSAICKRSHDGALEVDLRCADLSSIDLRFASLPRENLQGANLNQAVLQGSKLQGADLLSTTLWGARCEGAVLRGACLCDMEHEGMMNDYRVQQTAQAGNKAMEHMFAELKKEMGGTADQLEGGTVDEQEAAAVQAQAEGEDGMNEMLLAGGEMFTAIGANLLGPTILDVADLRRAVIICSAMQAPSFCGADLRGAKVRGSYLDGAAFDACDMRGVNFNSSCLTGCTIDAETKFTAAPKLAPTMPRGVGRGNSMGWMVREVGKNFGCGHMDDEEEEDDDDDDDEDEDEDEDGEDEEGLDEEGDDGGDDGGGPSLLSLALGGGSGVMHEAEGIVRGVAEDGVAKIEEQLLQQVEEAGDRVGEKLLRGVEQVEAKVAGLKTRLDKLQAGAKAVATKEVQRVRGKCSGMTKWAARKSEARAAQLAKTVAAQAGALFRGLKAQGRKVQSVQSGKSAGKGKGASCTTATAKELQAFEHMHTMLDYICRATIDAKAQGGEKLHERKVEAYQTAAEQLQEVEQQLRDEACSMAVRAFDRFHLTAPTGFSEAAGSWIQLGKAVLSSSPQRMRVEAKEISRLMDKLDTLCNTEFHMDSWDETLGAWEQLYRWQRTCRGERSAVIVEQVFREPAFARAFGMALHMRQLQRHSVLVPAEMCPVWLLKELKSAKLTIKDHLDTYKKTADAELASMEKIQAKQHLIVNFVSILIGNFLIALALRLFQWDSWSPSL
jgi:uncharacterized protein YjbI with pentapeptide repeats